MARKHFGLSYLEELALLKERDNIRRESRQEFLKFKQKADDAQRTLNKQAFEVTSPNLSNQPEPNFGQSPQSPFLHENTDLPVEWDISKSVKTNLSSDVSVMEHQTHLEMQQKKSKKENSRVGSLLEEEEKGPVAIASLVGTAKQVSILKKPQPSQKPTFKKFVRVQLRSEKPVIPQQEVCDTEQPEQKIYSQFQSTGTVGTSSVARETDHFNTVDSKSSEKHAKITKEISKPSILNQFLDFDGSRTRKMSEASNVKSMSGSLQETRGIKRSKIYEKSSPSSKSQMQDSTQKFPPGVVPRSIDEIIASLQSTSPTPSDLRIKELLESVLGHDYNIKIESPVKVPVKAEEAKEEIPVYSLQPQGIEIQNLPDILESPSKEEASVNMEQLKVESWIEEFPPPAEQATPADSEQIQLDTFQSSQLENISPLIEKQYVKVEEDTPKARAQEVLPEVPAEKPVVEIPQNIPSLPKSEEELSSSDESISLEPQVLEETSAELEELDSASSLNIRGKAYPKAEPVKAQKSIEDLAQQQPLSLLSTWTAKIKDVCYPFIHHLCTASPRCVLPVDMQLVSRVSHTSDKTGHKVALPAVNPGYYESEDLFPAITLLEKQREPERVFNEGIPVSDASQCHQKEKHTVLPVHSLESVAEWQRKAEHYIEKPQLELLGEKVKLHPGTLKMFWTPAPLKFSAPASVMKQTLFSKYESNLINGVIYEDFSFDLREEEETESEDDFDNLLSNISVERRCYSCPSFTTSTTFELTLHKRLGSEPELLLHRDKPAFKISANFKATMEELKAMKKQDSFIPVKFPLPDAKVSATKDEKSMQPEKCISDPYSSPVKGPRGSTVAKEELKEELKDKAYLLEESRKAGIKYIVFPKSKQRKKSGKYLSPDLLQALYVKLQDSPRIIERTTSLGKLSSHNKYVIKVSRSVKYYRSPSLPCVLNFETFSEKNGGIPEHLNDYAWVKEIWNKWFDSVYPPSCESAESKAASAKKAAEEKRKEVGKVLSDSVIMEGEASQCDEFQSEIDRLTKRINEGCAPAYNYCRRGALHRKMGKLKTAMDDLEKAISLEPMLVNAYWHRHLLFLYQNKTRQALEDLSFIIKNNKNHADAYLSRAEIYKKQGDNSLAVINYTLAMRCRPTDDEIYYKRAEIFEEEGDTARAIDDYSKSIYYNPRRTDALMKHGLYYFNKSNWSIAINNFTDVIKINPDNAEARTFRGRAYFKQEEYKKAAVDFSAAIHLDPCNWLAFYYRGCILRKIDPKQALQDFSISVLLNDDYENLSCFIHRGILYTEMKQWLLATCDFENVVALDRCLTLPYINIGLIMLLHLDRYFEAIGQFTNAIHVDPLDTRPYMCRAQAYHKIHKLKEALRDVTRAIHLQPNSPHLCLIRGQYLLDMNNYELASFCVRQVAEMGQGSFECSIVQEAFVHSFCQNHNKAIECALTATKKQPESSTFVLLGKIQMKAKKYKDAVASFKQGLKLLMGTEKTVPCTFEAAEMYYFVGRCYMEQVALIEACDAFSTAVKMCPRYADAFYERGLCRMQLQQDNCILDFNKVLALSPKHFQAYLSRAAFFGSKGRYSKAIMNCTEAIRIHPISVRAYLYRGALKLYNRTYTNAIEDLNKTIELDNVCTMAYYNRGVCYHQMKDYKNDFTDATLNKPKDSQLFHALGICYHRLQKYEEAVKSFSAVLKLNPFSLDGYIGRGNSYMEYGHLAGLKQAQKDFLKAIHMNPLCIKARICLGYNLQSLGKFQKAWHQFSAAINIDPECHIAYDGRAIVCLQMGNTFAAFQDINTALKVTTNAEMLTNRGVINQFMGYVSCAMKDYQQAITIDPDYALAYFNAANIYFLNRQFSQAKDYYSKALSLDAKNESAFLNRAITNTLLQNFEEAQADFEKAICLSPFSAAIYYNKANLYSTLKQYEQAEEDISKALEIQPYDPLMYKLRADIRGKLGFIKEAIADYKKAINIQELIFTG
ncbi:tetratricopeptide repeat protein 6 isoform X2 [Paroedura picta]|uniref:tetratricopeptide repeat protein 6 isoform X2 n=1 Tax=Paroedura picta TaxID=143630 RepID=UPI0040565E01